MEQVITTIQNLLHAANNGEDNSVLLAMVEELKEALTEVRPVATPIVSNTAIAVMMPAGNRHHLPNGNGQKKPMSASPLWSVPKPPRQIVELEVEPVLAPASFSQNNDFSDTSLQNDVPEIDSPLATALPYVPNEPVQHGTTNPEPETVVAAVAEMAEMALADLRWAGGLAEPDHLVLPLTEEMIAEAVALETTTVVEATASDPMAEAVIEARREPKDLNEKMATRAKMLNEVLSNQQPELAEVLVEKRISDLRKAISINEKYQFIHSLFRGDEDMFERTVKTLNNFGILPEAEYWMQRELLIKMGWNDEDELVQRFISLVRRRFS
jgi:hypothetical protein